MRREDVKEIFYEKLSSILQREISNKDDELLCEGRLSIDSLDYLKLLTELEKEFEIEIDDDYWNNDYLNNLNAIIDFVYSKLNEK